MKRTTISEKLPEPARPTDSKLAAGDYSGFAGRFSNHIQVGIQDEEFVLDFFSRVGDHFTHVSRIFITPAHAVRFQSLLETQLARHTKAMEGKGGSNRPHARRLPKIGKHSRK